MKRPFKVVDKAKSFLINERKKFKKDDKSAYLFSFPYLSLFSIFIIIPVVIAILLSFTRFDMVGNPVWVGFDNYIYLLTGDDQFMKTIIPNTVKFAIITGPIGYALSFLLAWLLAQVPHRVRTVMAVIIYSPSLTAGITMSVLWKIIFSGDNNGYLNSLLLRLGVIVEPIQFLQSPNHLFTIMVIVTLWSSMGVGFLAMLAGILNIGSDLYEAAYIDGMKSRFQEIFYITIPSMKPQMLFGAVMAIIGSFSAGGIGVALSGANPTPQYAGSLVLNHIEDYGFIRYDMGIAATLSVILLLIIYVFHKLAVRLFREKD